MGSIVSIGATHANALLNEMASTFLDKKIIDQITVSKPTVAFLMRKAKPLTLGGNPKVAVRLTDPPEGSQYSHGDVRTFQAPVEPFFAQYPFSESDLGLSITETEMKEIGYAVSDDMNAVRLPDSENKRLVDFFLDVFEDKFSQLATGMENTLAKLVLLDGTQNAKASPGLDLFVSTTPATGAPGGISRVTQPAWRNFASPGIINPTTTDSLAVAFRAALRFLKSTTNGKTPDGAFAGEAFYEAASARAHGRNTMESRMGEASDFQFLNGKLMVGNTEIIYDPYFAKLDAAFPGLVIPWTKRCYLLNSGDIGMTYLPAQGEGASMPSAETKMSDIFVLRKPERPANQYVFYKQIQFTGNMWAKQLNTHAVLSIA